MFCKKCGKFLINDAKFCSECGTPVVAEVTESAAALASVTGDKPQPAFRFVADPEIKWDVEGYPTGEKKPTEEINFRWEKDERSEKAAALRFVYAPSEATQKPMAQPQKPAQTPTHPAGSIWSGEPVRTAQPAAQQPPEEPQTWPPFAQSRPAAQPPETPLSVTQPWPVQQPPIQKIIQEEPAWKPQPEEPVRQVAEILQTQPQPGDTVPTEEDLFGGSRPETDLGDGTRIIEKFYTFNQKNAEFQKLLNEQYEKIRREAGLMPGEASEPAAMPQQQPDVPQQCAEERKEPAHLELDWRIPEPENAVGAVLIGADAEAPVIPDALLSRFDTRDLRRDILGIAEESEEKTIVPQAQAPEEPEAAGSGREEFVPAFRAEAEQLTKSDGKPDAVIQAEHADEKLRKAAGAAVAGGIGGAEVKTEGQPAVQKLEAGSGDPKSQMSADEEKRLALNALWGTMHLEPISQEGKAGSAAVGAGQERTDSAEAVPTETKKVPSAGATEEERVRQAAVRVERHEKKGKAGKILLTIILLLILIEAAILIIQYAAPESAASAFIADKLGFLTDWFFAAVNGEGRIGELFSSISKGVKNVLSSILPISNT